jgi:hypothetical protein
MSAGRKSDNIGAYLVAAPLGAGLVVGGIYFVHNGISLISSGKDDNSCNVSGAHCNKKVALFDALGPVGGGLLETVIGLFLLLIFVGFLYAAAGRRVAIVVGLALLLVVVGWSLLFT